MTMPLPGWYQDPLNPDRQKWWDGTAWTEYTAPLASAAAASGTPVDPAPEASAAGGRIPDAGTPVEPSAEGFTGFGPPAPEAQFHPGATQYAGAQSYPGAETNPGSLSYPGGQQYAGAPADHPGYTDQPVQPGYSGYQRGYAGSHPAYTGYPGYTGYASSPQGSNPAALTGFILGITAFFLFFIPFLGTGIALGAGIFSAVGLAKQTPARAPMYKVFAIIGLVLGIIFTLVSALLLIAVFAVAGTEQTSYWAAGLG